MIWVSLAILIIAAAGARAVYQQSERWRLEAASWRRETERLAAELAAELAAKQAHQNRVCELERALRVRLVMPTALEFDVENLSD